MHTSYKRQRSTAEIVPMRCGFIGGPLVLLGLRLVDDILERRIVVSYETVRR
ncbi:hypothetical protein [Mesorhizobium amorphae]|uniref:hypothetical protein n=1 Tax=Mesorhizobium amorphae TaxID=71433 RepID=UPI0024E09A5D|nr:hypothetical protein [Mesorhizobium amorphae]